MLCRWIIGTLLVAPVAALTLVACATVGCSGPSPEPSASRPLVIGLAGDVDSWNPYTSNDATAWSILDLVYPRLVREWGADESDERFTPWLAESWEFSEDRLTLTFRLRRDRRSL